MTISKPTLMTLPAEIRQMILEALLVQLPRIFVNGGREDYAFDCGSAEDGRYKNLGHDARNRSKIICSAQLLRVNRQLYQEGISMLYGRNNLDLGRTIVQNGIESFHAPREALSNRCFALVRDIVLPFDYCIRDATVDGIPYVFARKTSPSNLFENSIFACSPKHRFLQYQIQNLPQLRSVRSKGIIDPFSGYYRTTPEVRDCTERTTICMAKTTDCLSVEFKQRNPSFEMRTDQGFEIIPFKMIWPKLFAALQLAKLLSDDSKSEAGVYHFPPASDPPARSGALLVMKKNIPSHQLDQMQPVAQADLTAALGCQDVGYARLESLRALSAMNLTEIRFPSS
ncbi:MAG: hypothetical protein Q9227_007788 [Pyrenula ochraceoflavens]